MYKVERAIIMAAGFGSRMSPLTLETPKPLVKVNGTRMIDTVIRGLHENGIYEIYVVAGYLKEQFYDVIMDKALSVGIGQASEKTIDEINIYEATKVAMKEAVQNSKIKPEHILVDAMPLSLDVPTTSIIKGDAKSITIAAASVIAKVTRDRMLVELDKKYPMYDLKHNKGYGTKKHIEALREYGITKYHRLSFAPVKENSSKILP